MKNNIKKNYLKKNLSIINEDFFSFTEETKINKINLIILKIKINIIMIIKIIFFFLLKIILWLLFLFYLNDNKTKNKKIIYKHSIDYLENIFVYIIKLLNE